MILVIGGAGSGKRDFVTRVLGYPPEAMTRGKLGETPVVYGLEEMNPLPSAETCAQAAVVICREVGCGVIPLDRAERLHREAVGRLCCELARQAEAVYRITCGLSMRLK